MIASVYSTLNGKVVGKHPTLGVLVSEDGLVLNRLPSYWKPIRYGWTKGSKYKDGYMHVMINHKAYMVHRLVLETFVGECPEGFTVDHINRIRDDNRLKNLRYADKQTQADNRSTVINALDLGVRSCEDPNEYAKRLYNTKKDNLEFKEYNRERVKQYRLNHLKDPEWVAKETERQRKKNERYKNDPEYKAHRNELQRLRRAKKKAERSAQPSV